MDVVVLTPVRLLGDALVACFDRYPGITVVAVVSDLAALRHILATTSADVVLIDVSPGIDLYDVRYISAEHPEVGLVALGLIERCQEVIRCGRAGFAGYVSRDATFDALCGVLSNIVEGRLACPAEISCSLLRALSRIDPTPHEPGPDHALTRRESDVLNLIGHGLSNKEIARELVLSVATVKHHVHNILCKLKVPQRAQAMRRVRDAPWIVSPPDTTLVHKAS